MRCTPVGDAEECSTSKADEVTDVSLCVQSVEVVLTTTRIFRTGACKCPEFCMLVSHVTAPQSAEEKDARAVRSSPMGPSNVLSWSSVIDSVHGTVMTNTGVPHTPLNERFLMVASQISEEFKVLNA